MLQRISKHCTGICFITNQDILPLAPRRVTARTCVSNKNTFINCSN